MHSEEKGPIDAAIRDINQGEETKKFKDGDLHSAEVDFDNILQCPLVSYEDSPINDKGAKSMQKEEMHEITPSPICEVIEMHDKEMNENLEGDREKDKEKEDKGEEVFVVHVSNVDSTTGK